MPQENPESGGPPLTPSAAALRAGFALSGLTVAQLYMGYLVVGGSMTAAEVSEVLHGHRETLAVEHDYLAQALNDSVIDRGLHHPVAYSDELHPADPPPPQALLSIARRVDTWLSTPVDTNDSTARWAEASYRDLLLRAIAEAPTSTADVMAGLSWSVTDELELVEFLHGTVTLATTVITVITAADGAGRAAPGTGRRGPGQTGIPACRGAPSGPRWGASRPRLATPPPHFDG